LKLRVRHLLVEPDWVSVSSPASPFFAVRQLDPPVRVARRSCQPSQPISPGHPTAHKSAIHTLNKNKPAITELLTPILKDART
jgi:hypothetical protein